MNDDAFLWVVFGLIVAATLSFLYVTVDILIDSEKINIEMQKIEATITNEIINGDLSRDEVIGLINTQCKSANFQDIGQVDACIIDNYQKFIDIKR